MSEDEFERLLERCSERLAEITLTIPALEDGAPRPPVYTLDPAPRPAPVPAPPAASFAPPPPPEPPAARHAPPVAAPVPEEPPDEDVFPPPRVVERAPPPEPARRSPRTPKPAPAPAPAAHGASRAAVAAAAAGVLAAAGAYGAWTLRRPAAELDIDAGSADAMAVRPEKGDVLVAQGRELLDLSRSGRTLGRSPLDGEVDTMCWNQGSLWTADGRTRAVVERGEGGRITVFSLNHVPGALYAKDRYLWTAEKNGGALHQFLISRSILGAILQPIDSFQLNGLSPESFTIDDEGTLWVADAATRRLYRLRLENGSYKRVSSAPLSPVVGPQGKLRDLTVDGDGVWILAEQSGGRAALRRIALARLDWSPS